MKNIIFSALLAAGLSQSAFAEVGWKEEAKQWEQNVTEMGTYSLYVSWVSYLSKEAIACTASNTVVGVSIVADTVPVANILSEIAANMADETYESTSAQDFGGQLGDAFKGTFAGSGALVKDGIQFLLLTLAGEQDRAWQGVESAYASSITLANKFAEDKSLCQRLSRIQGIIGQEISLRWNAQEGEENLTPEEKIQIILP